MLNPAQICEHFPVCMDWEECQLMLVDKDIRLQHKMSPGRIYVMADRPFVKKLNPHWMVPQRGL